MKALAVDAAAGERSETAAEASKEAAEAEANHEVQQLSAIISFERLVL